MRGLAIAVCVLALAGCGQGLTPAERQAQNAKDVAQVKAANVVPPTPVAPDPILYPDIEKAGIYGASCSFAPKGGGLGAVAIAMEDHGYMKIDGKLIIFVSDKGSDELVGMARAHYDSRKYSFTLDISRGDGSGADPETHNYPAVFVLRNDLGQAVYEVEGLAQCGA